LSGSLHGNCPVLGASPGLIVSNHYPDSATATRLRILIDVDASHNWPDDGIEDMVFIHAVQWLRVLYGRPFVICIGMIVGL
jgi:hypothetical protein